jgi:uncharacterized membrane protein YadS
VAVALAALGSSVGFFVGRRQALWILPSIVAVCILSTKVMRLLPTLPEVLWYSGAALLGTWIGLAIRRLAERPSV